ncbi:transcription factor HES-5-like [Polymixia lowei]
MAPVKVHSVMLTGKDKIKLRKPVVEKMRRDRINSSIQQLKTLLEKELHAQQPSSKLEKADILETAVCYLKENAVTGSPGAPGQSYAEGFTRCLEEALLFLSAHNQPSESRQKLVNHFSRAPLQCSGAGVCPGRPVVHRRSRQPKCANGGQSLWRPW